MTEGLSTASGMSRSKCVETDGVISWFSRHDNKIFGYIESSCGKEVYFDTSSLMSEEDFDISEGDSVRFIMQKSDLGYSALEMRKKR